MKENYLEKIEEIQNRADEERKIFSNQKEVYDNKMSELEIEFEKLLPPIGTIIVVDCKEYKIDCYLTCIEHPKLGTVYVKEKEKNGEWSEFCHGILEPNTANVWDFVK